MPCLPQTEWGSHIDVAMPCYWPRYLPKAYTPRFQAFGGPLVSPTTSVTSVSSTIPFVTSSSTAKPFTSYEPSDIPVPLQDLWTSFSGTRTYKLQTLADIYDELCGAINKGESLFSCPLRPATEEIGIECDDNNFGINIPVDPEDYNFGALQTETRTGDPSYPWPSLVMFAADLLFSSPRLRFSQAQQKAILSWANELSAKYVPTLHALKKCQETIRHLNSIGKAIAKDYSNPITWFSMQDYPKDGEGSMSQAHHGSKMLLDPHPSLAVPSVSANSKIFFVDELLQQSSGAYFIPKQFFQSRDQLDDVEILLLGYPVARSEAGFIVDLECVIATTSTFKCTYENIHANEPEFCGFTGDNPMHAEECSHFGLQSNLFCRTCKVGGTQAHKKTDEGYQKVFGCSEPRTPQETCEAIKHQINTSLEPRGTEKVKRAAKNSGIRNTASDLIIRHLLELGKQLRKRKEGKPALPEAEVRQRLEQELETLLQGATLDDHINPLLGMPGVNVHQDTPTEILHTVLLGVAHLESLSKDGLNSPQLGAEYICRYKGGLIGKHFESLAQSRWNSPGDQSMFLKALAFTTRNGDEAKVGSYVVVSSLSTETPLWIGKIEEILITEANRQFAAHVAFTYMDFLPALHANLQVPCLRITESQDVLPAEKFLCSVNVLHDCCMSNCSEFKTAPVQQEYSETTKLTKTVAHKQTNKYVLNSSHQNTLVTNVQEIRLNAAKLVCEKKTLVDAAGTTGADTTTNLDETPMPAVRTPAFDRTPFRRGKKKTISNRPTIAGADTPQHAHAPVSPQIQSPIRPGPSRIPVFPSSAPGHLQRVHSPMHGLNGLPAPYHYPPQMFSQPYESSSQPSFSPHLHHSISQSHAETSQLYRYPHHMFSQPSDLPLQPSYPFQPSFPHHHPYWNTQSCREI
ncbi:hypothetical protein SERLADRAFT_436680 [Serpula lacrymans var. lacrymans S7.9]|uniref:BAH domain-containing protein n=1 Tax=Serpula lacrymans var. lacrymans (strain S7.9) TaxID=578457 RepID=F8NS20_SERL9|nr:uncharacterized protein SERLADRAFT_436680 [Serpula lacrymans var. lacrymans S7.9]EGO26853.1 hypothetical protein SERLADRAFT_436680 [Serpula lacrymans var. lacrymans S7.9]